MKMNLPSKLVALTLAVSPNVASAGLESGSNAEIDADLNINLRITGEGEVRERNGRESSRFVTSRMGSREILATLEGFRRVLFLDEGAEGEDAPQPFPRGSRLLKTVDDGVWVVDREGNMIFDARPYISVGNSLKNEVVAYNLDNNTGNIQLTSLGQLYIEISLDGLMMANSEASEAPGNYTEADGASTKRYSERFSRVRVTETMNISSRVSGGGWRPGLGPIVAEGSVSLRGRNVESNVPR